MTPGWLHARLELTPGAALYASLVLAGSGVERKFEIIGEALNRIERRDPDLLERIRDHRDIISFRNILAHGYDTVDDRIVWNIIVEDLDRLMEDVRTLFHDA